MKYQKNHLKNIILGLLIIVCQSSYSQSIHTACPIQKEGLHDKDIWGIHQDHQGLIWIRNKQKFILYDGYHIQNPKNYYSLYKQEGIASHQITRLNVPKSKKAPTNSYAMPAGRLERGLDIMRFTDRNLNQWVLSSQRILKNGKPINIKNIQGFLQQYVGELKFNAHFQSLDGVLWIGTNKGLFKIIEENYQSKEALPISITGIQYYDQGEETWKPTSSNRHSEMGLVEVALKDTPLRLNFALSNYHSSLTNQFEYRFKGQHETWVGHGINNHIVCENMKPGKYELEIRGKHTGGVWSSTSMSLHILDAFPIVHSYVWWLILLGAVMLLSYFIYQSHSLSKFSPTSFKKNINEEINNRIEDDVARMGMEIELLRTQTHHKDQRGIMMKNISIAARNVISTIGDVLWLIDVRRDTMEHLLDRIKEQANETLGSQEVGIAFSNHIIHKEEPMSFAFKQSLFFFCKNTMNSIAMNSNIKHVHIILNEKPLQFELSFVLDKKMVFGTICQEIMKKESQKIKGKLSFQQKEIQLIIPNPKGLNIKSLSPLLSMNSILR